MTTMSKLFGIPIGGFSKIMGVRSNAFSKIMGMDIVLPPLFESDADANTFVMLMSAANDGDDETGAGLALSGVNLVGTEVGGVVAAVNNWRTFDSNNDYMTFTSAWCNAWMSDSTWAVHTRIRNVESGSYLGLFTAQQDASYGFGMQLNNRQLRVFSNIGGVFREATTPNAIGASDTVWVSAWADGVNNIRAGFTTQTVLPTSWDDFASGDRCTPASTGNFTGINFNRVGYGPTFYNYGSVSADWLGCEAQLIVASKNGLA